jgi:hypothetical protein
MQQAERVLVLIYQTARPFLCNDREMGGYTRAVSGQRLGKYVPATTDTKATMVQQRRGKHISAAMNPDTTEELCFLCDPCRDVTSMDKVS